MEEKEKSSPFYEDFSSVAEAHRDYAHLRVAVVHYWLVSWRGGEKVLASVLKLFPQADIYTLFYDPEKVPEAIRRNHKITASCLNGIPFFRRHYQKVFPFYPLGIRSLSLKEKEYDLVISNESGPAKGVELPEGALHFCLCQTPMRYCWGFREEYLRGFSPPLRLLLDFLFERLRKWDETTKNNVGYYAANSTNVQKRILKYYGLPSQVLHPPVSLDYFKESKEEKNEDFSSVIPEKPYYIFFSALTPYKRADIALQACKELGRRLVIAGTGSEEGNLHRMADEQITFTGAIADAPLKQLLTHAEALIFPGEEDFGIVPLEAQAVGTPVICYGEGGVKDTVIPYQGEESTASATGLYFEEQTTESLTEAIQRFEKLKKTNKNIFPPEKLKEHARRFGEDFFLRNLKNQLDTFLKEPKVTR